MGTGDILLGGNPVMDYHPVQGRVAILLGMLYAKETWIRSGRLGLWLLCALTFFYFLRNFSRFHLQKATAFLR